MTISASRGSSRSTPLRLWARAPEMTMRSDRGIVTSLRTRTGVPVGAALGAKNGHPKCGNTRVVRGSTAIYARKADADCIDPAVAPRCPLRSSCELRGEQRVDGSASAHRRFVDVLVGAVGNVQATAAVREGRDPELRVPAGVQHTGAQPKRRGVAFDRLDTPSQRLGRGVVLVHADGGLRLQHLDVDVCTGVLGRLVDPAGESRELGVEVFLGVEAAVDGEPRRAGDDIEARAGAGLP